MQSPAPMSKGTSQWVDWLWYRSQATHQPESPWLLQVRCFDSGMWVTMTLVSKSPWLWQVSLHDCYKWVTMTLVSKALNPGMVLTKAISLFDTFIDFVYNNHHVYIAQGQLSKPSVQGRLLCRGIGPFILYCTCLLWGCMSQLWNCNISFFCFTIRSLLSKTLPRWNECFLLPWRAVMRGHIISIRWASSQACWQNQAVKFD